LVPGFARKLLIAEDLSGNYLVSILRVISGFVRFLLEPW
jgi:hypothetical protein